MELWNFHRGSGVILIQNLLHTTDMRVRFPLGKCHTSGYDGEAHCASHSCTRLASTYDTPKCTRNRMDCYDEQSVFFYEEAGQED